MNNAPFEMTEDRLNYIDASEELDEGFTADARVEVDQARHVYEAAAEALNQYLEETNVSSELIAAFDKLAKSLTSDPKHTGYTECEVCEKVLPTTQVSKYQAWTVCEPCKQSKIEMDKETEPDESEPGPSQSEIDLLMRYAKQPFIVLSDPHTAWTAEHELPYTELKVERSGAFLFFTTVNDRNEAAQILRDKVEMTIPERALGPDSMNW